MALGSDPFFQSIILFDGTGEKFNISMQDIWDYNTYSTRICINYASQLSASAILLIVILILTKQEKRSSFVFLSNGAALLVNIPRTLFAALYFTSSWYWPYAYFAGDYSRVSALAVNLTTAGVVFDFLVLVPILMSLTLQVRVVMVTQSDVQKFWVMLLSITIGMIAIGFRFALSIINANMIRKKEGMAQYYWLMNSTNIMLTISICFYSAIFTGKLAHAIIQRRKLGLRKFGPMQIIFIMGCQTFIIPAIFSGLQYVSPVPEFGSQVYTIVALFLPLSAIWASAAIDERNATPCLGVASNGKHSISTGGTSTKVSRGTCSSMRIQLMDIESDPKCLYKEDNN